MPTTEQEMVVIDGVGMPLWMYVAVKDRAVWTNETQFVGVKYHAPAHMAFDPRDPHSLHIRKVEVRVNQVREGKNLSFVLGASREQLTDYGIDNFLMILWISPKSGVAF